MCDCDCEAPSVYRESFPRARKQYQCCECEAFIQPGDQYRHTFGVWDGEPGTYRTCLPCAELGSVFAYVTGRCLCYGGLLEDIIEHAMYRHSDDDDDEYVYECDDPWKVAAAKAAYEGRRQEILLRSI